MNSHKNLINLASDLELFESLEVIRAYFQFLQFREPLPLTIQIPSEFYQLKKLDRGIHEWDLVVLLKEVIVYSKGKPGTTSTLRKYNQLINALRCIIVLENELYEENKDVFSKNALSNLYRVIHRQIPWQVSPNSILSTRYFKIYSYPALQEIVRNKFGISVKEIYTVGFAAIGFFLKKFAVDYHAKIEIPGITSMTLEKFVVNFSKSLEEIRVLMAKNNSYGQDYLYNFNPLKQYPIIKTFFEGRESLIVPVPTFLLHRFTDGLFYEICNEKGFSAAYGDAFQSYVGEVLGKINTKNKFQIVPEERYSVNKQDKRSVDWIVNDGSANLFIECKTKRLHSQAKVSLVDNVFLAEDLTKLSDGIVQIYKTIIHYKNNIYRNFKNNGQKVYPLLVTLDDWLIFGPILNGELEKRVQKSLGESNISLDVLVDMPYTVCSIDEMEIVMHVINNHSVAEVMEGKLSKRGWTLHDFLANTYKKDFNESSLPFPDEYSSLLDISNLAPRQ